MARAIILIGEVVQFQGIIALWLWGFLKIMSEFPKLLSEEQSDEGDNLSLVVVFSVERYATKPRPIPNPKKLQDFLDMVRKK